MQKLRKGIFIVLPIFIALYQLYLINRIWHYDNKISIVIALFLVFTLYVVFFLFYKKINYKHIEKRKFLIITIISLVLSIIILISNFNFFSKKYLETTVYLYTDNNNIPIKNIIIDNTVQTIEDENKISPIELTYSNCKDIIIVLEKNQENVNIYIQDGKKLEQVNLNDYSKDIYTYKVTSNSTMSPFSIVRAILSFIMIEILSFMLCMSSYFLYKKKRSLLIPTLFIIALIQIIFYQQNTSYVTGWDTFDYERSWSQEKILSGTLDGRTPIYPFIIKAFEFLFGNDLWTVFLSKGQIIVSFISIIFLYKTFRLLIKSEKLTAVITLLYGISIAVIGWNICLLTESFALSGTVFMSYLLIYYIKNKKIRYGIFSIILAFLITFLRPACISYIAILFAFFLLHPLFNKQRKEKDFICLGVSLITIILTLSYATVFYKQTQIFSISDAKTRQDLYVCILQGFYKNINDEQFEKYVEESMEEFKDDEWSGVHKVLRKYGNKKSQELIKMCKNASKKQYIEYLVNTIKHESSENFGAYNTLCISNSKNIQYNFIKSFSFLNFFIVYIILIIEGILSIYRWIKNKKPNWINLGLFGFLLAILVTSFIGTNAEFMRTSICVVPFSYLAIGTLINDCIKKFRK